MNVNFLLNPKPKRTAPDTTYGQLIASSDGPTLSSPCYDYHQARRAGPLGLHQPLGTVSENRDQTVTLTSLDSQPGSLYSQLQTCNGIEVQQLYMILPGNQTLLPVPIDRSRASREMDEKRECNAWASKRYRNRQAVLEEIAEHEEKLQQVLKQLDHLTQLRGFYENEIYRLRDLLCRVLVTER